MALTLAASCSRDKDVDNLDNNNKIDDTTIEEIVLGAGQSVSVTPASRGIGAVGDLAATNSWNGETVYVYGINNGAYGAEGATKTVVINADQATAPEYVDQAIEKGTLTLTGQYFYNGNDVYDFYAAHIDDAVLVDPTSMDIPLKTEPVGSKEPEDLSNGFFVKLKIDGTQDIMVASTDKSADITAVVDGEVQDTDADKERVYSAWSARRDVVPNLKFNHLLTQLRFNARTGSNSPITETANAIKIKSIEVKNVVNTGTLTIIPGGTNPEQGFEADTDAPKVSFWAKQIPANKGDKLADFPEAGVDVTTKVSENHAPVSAPMLLYPQDTYEIVITTSQTPVGGTEVVGTIEGTLKVAKAEGGDAANTSGIFDPGVLYDVNITVYDVEKIEISGELIEWKYGGSIDVDPDDVDEIPVTPGA
ncbi:fimbrillin family protein [Bacteroides caecigallinarum]|uniref:fimbrillin family protein n=1 Tax=Bacteroides caecigallinarum TaxID=1411144 RepID=UPI001F410DA1|nr:fimbrillin family protein [Bacteroides caecigallinarum]MCF2594845.1 fimbrillin family protein [Bacteroides caecigallinarum]